jgi:hypothetical protein
MSDPTTTERIVKYSEEWWASRSPEIRARRCHGHNGDHEPCRKTSMDFQQVCGTHGGRAPQAKRKARQRLEEAQDRMAKALLGIAEGAESEAVKLAAIKHVLAIGGLSEKHAVAVEVELKPYEDILANLGGVGFITREESRARRGLPALGPADPTAPLDVEVVEEGVGERHPDSPSAGCNPAEEGDGPPSRPAFAEGDVGPSPGNALMTMEDAVAATSPRYIRSQRIRRHR